MRRRTILVMLFPIVLFAIGQPRNASAELARWDQERVAKIAADLYEAVKDLRDTARKQPPPTAGSLQTRSHYRLLDDLRLIRNETKHLANELKAGQSRDETFPVYRRVQGLRRTAAENARRLFIHEPVLAKIDAARDVLRRLRPYYEEEPKAEDEPGDA